MNFSEHKRAEDAVSLLQTTALAIAESNDVQQALEVVLQHVCEATGWLMGQAWHPRDDGNVLECSPAWYGRLSGLEVFRQLSEHTTFVPGEGLPGRVWQTKQAHWIRDVTVDENFPRWLVARTAGLKAGMAFPVLAGDEVVAVIEFFVVERRDEDDHLIKLVSAVASQLGTLIRRKQAEDALRISEERHRFISEAVSDYAFVYDIDDHGQMIMTWVTGAFTRITGYTPEEMATFALWEAIVNPEDRDIPAQRRQRMLAGQPDMSEYRICAKDGRIVWLRFYGHPVLDSEQKRLVRVYGAAQDITRIKQLEQQLQQAQKMEAIGRLAGGVAHDFNNILTVIGGHCALVLDELGYDHPVRADIEQIQSAADRAVKLTRQLLLFSRQQVQQPYTLNLNLVVAGIETLLRRLIGEDIDLVIQLDPQLGLIRADPGQMEQVLMNLSVNARDAMPGGGRLLITTANAELDTAIAQQHDDPSKTAYILLAISDTGDGIDADVQSHIFEPFFTTKGPGKWTGLGLATVHGIINQNGGHISVGSQPGQGTTFKIYLPREPAELQEPML